MENYTDRNDGCNESDILFYIEWAQQREPSIQFHIESILNGVRVRHYSALNGGRQTPNVHCLFLFNGTHSFLLNSACGSELNGSRQSPNVRCLFLYRSCTHFTGVHPLSGQNPCPYDEGGGNWWANAVC